MSNRYSILAIGLVAIVAACALSGVLLLANDDSNNSDTSDTNSTVRSFSSYSNYSAETNKVCAVEEQNDTKLTLRFVDDEITKGDALERRAFKVTGNDYSELQIENVRK